MFCLVFSVVICFVYLCSIYGDVTIGEWRCWGLPEERRLVRRLSYTAPTGVRWGPSSSRMVELQELHHGSGGSFVRWSVVLALDALMGDRFYVQMRVGCRSAPAGGRGGGGGVEVDQRVGLVFRRSTLGFGSIIQKETQTCCQKSLERWQRWALPASSPSLGAA